MNSVQLIGHLVSDPEVKYLPSGDPVAKFALAVDRAGDKEADGYAAGFFDVECWGKTAELVEQYLSKGRQVGVTGRLKHHKWEQDGNKRSKVEVVASHVTFVGSKDDGDGGQSPLSQAAAAGTEDDADDIPF